MNIELTALFYISMSLLVLAVILCTVQGKLSDARRHAVPNTTNTKLLRCIETYCIFGSVVLIGSSLAFLFMFGVTL